LRGKVVDCLDKTRVLMKTKLSIIKATYDSQNTQIVQMATQ
jgi:hypothetical protein